MSTPGEPQIKPSGKRPNWQETLIVIAVIAGVTLTVLFSFRLYNSIFMLHRNRIPPGTIDVNYIQGWMNVPYVARAYRIPETNLWQYLQVPEAKNRMKSLNTLNREYTPGQPGLMVERIKQVILQFQAAHPTPGTGAPSRTPTP